MKIVLSTFLVLLCTLVLPGNVQAQVTSTTSDTSDTPTTVATPTITDVPTTSTTVASSTTTTTTVATTTASDVPTTTTVATTTKSSTTEPSSSTSTVTPTTTFAPATSTKAPEPSSCSWNVTEGDVTCIRAQIKAKFVIDIEGKKHPINLGCNASTARSDCSSNVTQTLVLSEENYNLTMVFEKDSKNVFARVVAFSYEIPEGKGAVSNDSEKLFVVKTGNSYLCKSQFDLKLENVTVQFLDVKVQAFLEKNENFGAVEECKADEVVSDVVPIAVGIALGALIIIVLIAYLVGRRRSRQRGYQSV